MGRAFHRKQSISLDRSHSRGIGIRYVNSERSIPASTPERLAAKAAERAAEDHRRAVRDAQIAAYGKKFDALVGMTEIILNEWKRISDNNDRCIATFPGWTKGNYCPLPVDRATADFYVEHVRDFMAAMASIGREPSIMALDGAFDAAATRRVPTEQVVVDAMAAVKCIGRDCIDTTGFDVARFVQKLARRANRDKHGTEDIDGALGYVRRQLVAVLRYQG
jgi:hypothetical protein